MKNTFNQLVEDFGNEWTEYDYSKTNKEAGARPKMLEVSGAPHHQIAKTLGHTPI